MNVKPIAYIHSPYGEKFAVPRQPNLVQQLTSTVRLIGEANCSDAVRGLTDFSHLWLIFQFHLIPLGKWHPLVRPPRMGGNQKVGVFASRSSFRPNNIGLSVVELLDITFEQNQVTLVIQGGDFVDGTPVIDIKPYIPYSDCIPHATEAYASRPIVAAKPITFDPACDSQLNKITTLIPEFKSVVSQVLQQDPRPGYRRGSVEEKTYGVTLYNYNIRFRFEQECIKVTAIAPAD
ncbi:tRNA (N6-threonylcarbamoyladenosine(37)-N6)-methyltransferase TrmO [Pleionea litopenaei]|uniref:tRNA (N6-threonylcarbamoyladenosine(37)-N6)-methyltransferase TrmO n=1 Tax=Pleionea litopenaei TaxID=3070815 RepID=A0AA51RUZ0_9GAMM|nr:tRNA (N6-threonylcarbamoyladenosine(37)-N6)-methyltransferase TrmO [Pleionea sp. HL-JVS1]WMS88128.1 tRNA (N6-threonylcarbamoyladenosine(37)-N6)-methyltransferase TrmO [Pleionea sp. HL-JVS1]